MNPLKIYVLPEYRIRKKIRTITENLGLYHANQAKVEKATRKPMFLLRCLRSVTTQIAQMSRSHVRNTPPKQDKLP